MSNKRAQEQDDEANALALGAQRGFSDTRAPCVVCVVEWTIEAVTLFAGDNNPRREAHICGTCWSVLAFLWTKGRCFDGASCGCVDEAISRFLIEQCQDDRLRKPLEDLVLRIIGALTVERGSAPLLTAPVDNGTRCNARGPVVAGALHCTRRAGHEHHPGGWHSDDGRLANAAPDEQVAWQDAPKSK